MSNTSRFARASVAVLLASTATVLLGGCSWFSKGPKGDYALAAEEFQRLVQRYPRHDKTPGGMLKLGLAQFGLKQDALGRRTLEAVVKQYPGSDEARAAQQRLKPAPAKQ